MSHVIGHRNAEQAAGALTAAAVGATGVLALTLAAQGGAGQVTWTGFPFALRILDLWVVRTVGASPGAHTTTFRRQAGEVITDDMNTNVADTSVVRAGRIFDNFDDIAAGGQIQADVSAASADMIVYIEFLRT